MRERKSKDDMLLRVTHPKSLRSAPLRSSEVSKPDNFRCQIILTCQSIQGIVNEDDFLCWSLGWQISLVDMLAVIAPAVFHTKPSPGMIDLNK